MKNVGLGSGRGWVARIWVDLLARVLVWQVAARTRVHLPVMVQMARDIPNSGKKGFGRGRD